MVLSVTTQWEYLSATQKYNLNDSSEDMSIDWHLFGKTFRPQAHDRLGAVAQSTHTILLWTRSHDGSTTGLTLSARFSIWTDEGLLCGISFPKEEAEAIL